MDQLTWGALHIDFGDVRTASPPCSSKNTDAYQLFGAAQERSFLPEKVPFRLTKMMTNAFELSAARGHKVPGSRGSFKQASIVTMRVMRDSRSSLLAMLEAFLYDPLLSWTVCIYFCFFGLANDDQSDASPSANLSDPATSESIAGTIVTMTDGV